MQVGRFVCVAMPMLLCLAAIIVLLYAVLSGVAHRNLDMFQLDFSNFSMDASEFSKYVSGVDDIEGFFNGDADVIQSLLNGDDVEDQLNNLKDSTSDAVDEVSDKISDVSSDVSNSLKNVNFDSVNLDNIDLGDFFDGNSKRSALFRRANNITAESLNMSQMYTVDLWGYCAYDQTRDRECSSPRWNWAADDFDTAVLDDLFNQTGINITLPSELHDALEVFKPVVKWTQIGFVVSLVALGIELALGIFANCTRVMSCIVWLWAGIATTLVIATSALATVSSLVIVGAMTTVGGDWGVKARVNTSFLATIWIGAALSIAAGLFWIFTICCCKPESRSDRKSRKRQSDGEKLLPGNQGGAYGQLHDETDHASKGLTPSGQPSPGFSPGFANSYNNGQAPQYPRNARSDLAYEPYSNRA